MRLCQVVGHICYHILAAGLNGYLATVTTLNTSSEQVALWCNSNYTLLVENGKFHLVNCCCTALLCVPSCSRNCHMDVVLGTICSGLM
ncbi:hypothetical protein ACSBR2_012649 [Camellia fascicularis]